MNRTVKEIKQLIKKPYKVEMAFNGNESRYYVQVVKKDLKRILNGMNEDDKLFCAILDDGWIRIASKN